MAGSISWDLFARDHASATFDKLGNRVGAAESKFASFAKKALIAGAVVGAALVKFGASSVKAFVEAEASQKKLEDAYSRFPKLADVKIGALRAESKALENKTKFDDDAIVAGQAQLAMYKLTGKQVKDLTPLLVDYAARTGKDLPDAANTLGKALLGQGRGLKDIGIKFKDLKNPAANFKELMTGLRTQVGGFATKEGATAAGKLAELKNKFGDLQETVGQELLPALTKLLDIGLKVADWANKHQKLTKDLVIGVGALTVAFIALSVAMAIVELINPFSALALGVVAATAGVIILYNRFAVARRIINDVGNAVMLWARLNILAFKLVANAARLLARGFLTFLLNPILTVFSAILHGAALAFGWIHGIGGKLRTARDAFDRFRSDINRIVGGITGKKTFVLDAHVTQATRNAFAMYLNTPSSRIFTTYFQTVKLPGGRMAGFASGGRPPVGEVVKVGEHGTEYVQFDRPASVYPHGQKPPGMSITGGTASGAGAVYVTVNVAGSVIAERDLGDTIAKVLERRAGRGAVLHVRTA